MNSHHEQHAHHHDEPVGIPAERLAICPVTGIKVDREEAEKLGHTREYNGQKLYFCCATCVHQFDEHPEKYAHKGKTKA